MFGKTDVRQSARNDKHRSVYHKTDDPVYYYMPPTEKNGVHNYFGYPVFEDPQDIKDEEFFGKWDNNSNTWISEPYFNYINMRDVENAAKSGNYTAAKKELRKFYKSFVWKCGTGFAYDKKAEAYLDALSRNVFAYSYISVTAIGSFTLPAEEWGKTRLDVLNEILTAKGSYTDFNIMIASADKFYTTGQYYSKDASDASVRPILRLVVNGKTTEIQAYKDTMVVAGIKRDVNYGYDEIIELQEHGCYDDTLESYHSCNEDTKRSFICFDISSLSADDEITSAALVLTGRNIITDETRKRFADAIGVPYSGKANEKLCWAVWYKASAWEEDKLTWSSQFFADKFYFSCNDMSNWDYITPDNPSLKGKVCDYHRFAQQSSLISAYAVSGDERFAYTNLRQCMAMYSSLGLEPGVMNSLDMSVYLGHLCDTIYTMINSRYMSDDIFTALLKFAWQLCDFQTEKWFGCFTNNWATFATSGNYKVCAYFPEFARHDYWYKKILEEHERLFEGFTFEDGHCIEVSQGYIETILDTFTPAVTVFSNTHHPAPYTATVYKTINDIIKNALYSSGGAGYGGFNIADSSDIGKSRVWMYEFWHKYVFRDDEELEYIVSRGEKGKLPDNPTINYPVALRTFMRSGWDLKKALQMSFINTSDERASHFHNDCLSVAMYAYGKYLLVDSGYGSDQTGDSGRVWEYNKSPVQHNLMTVNDTYDYLTDGVCAYTKLARNSTWAKKFESNKDYDFTEYVCDGYQTAKTMQRSVTFLKNKKFWIISDYAIPSNPDENNVFAQHWHFAPGSNPTHNANYTIRSNFDDVNVMVVPLEYEQIDDVRYVDTYYGGMEGQKIINKKAVVTKSKKGAGRFTTLILPVDTDEDFKVVSRTLENKNSIDDNLLHMVYFEIVNVRTGVSNRYYYYHINDDTKKSPDGMKFSDFVTDATTAIIEQNENADIISYILTDGTYLKEL